MKTVVYFGIFTLFSMTGCYHSSEPKAADILGVWECHTRSESITPMTDMQDTKTFTAEGIYSSSKFPEGKNYKYRLDKDKLIVTFPKGDWVESISNLTSASLEYFNNKAGYPLKVSCHKK
jgi:hypothetical protein